jgi:hypothetical protein
MRRQLHSLLFRLSPRCKGTVNGQPEPATPETRAGKVSGVCVFRSASFARRSTFSLSSPCLSNTPSAERVAAASSCADGETETGRKRPLAPETSGTGGSNPSCSATESHRGGILRRIVRNPRACGTGRMAFPAASMSQGAAHECGSIKVRARTGFSGGH